MLHLFLDFGGGIVLRLLHHPQEVFAPNFFEVFVGESAVYELHREVEYFVGRAAARYAAVAVEVGAKAHVVYSGHIDHVEQVGHGVVDSGIAGFAEKSAVERHLCHSAALGQCAQLVVGEVARMVAQGAAVAMTAHDGGGTDVEGIVEAFLAGMAQVDHDAVKVHLLDDALAELAHAIVGVTPAC